MPVCGRCFGSFSPLTRCPVPRLAWGALSQVSDVQEKMESVEKDGSTERPGTKQNIGQEHMLNPQNHNSQQ